MALNIEPHKRIAVVLFHLESALKDARDAATEQKTDKLYKKLEVAFELMNPLLASLTILEESQRRSLVEKLLGSQN